MLIAPADSPNSVTLPGSPPKAAMFSLTQSQSRDLVAQAPVPPPWVVRVHEIGVGEEAEGAQPVVDRHDDHALGGETTTGEQRARTGAGGEPAPVQPHHDRPSPVVEPRCPHVEVQAVLVRRGRVVREAEAGDRWGLGRDRPPRRRHPGAGPGLGGLRRPPPAFGPGHPGVGDAPKDPDPGLQLPLERSGRGTGHALQGPPHA